MTPKVKYWQWPNVLAIDAAFICVAWQMALARTLGCSIEWPAYTALGLSVWLTYVADRLFDISTRDASSLLSLRHQFSKRFARPLWCIWFGVLALNLLLSTELTSTQLKSGALLLAVCLVYTLLNQKLSRRFFPKEICVALIYAGGTAILLPTTWPFKFVAIFALLCLLNCLIIGTKEKSIDQEMQIHSITPLLTEKWLGLIALVGIALSFTIEAELNFSMGVCFGLLGLLHAFRKSISIESFRIIADSVLLVGPLLAFAS